MGVSFLRVSADYRLTAWFRQAGISDAKPRFPLCLAEPR
jgi:hypothetical protein